MSSNLRVNNILPSVGTNVAIGTAGGSITLTGSTTGDITSSGVSTFSNIRITGGTISGVSTAGITTVYTNSFNGGQLGGSRNMIINGSMVVSQRGFSGAAGTTTDGSYTTDRFLIEHSHDGAVSVGQTTMNSTIGGNAYTDGFKNALIFRVTTADSSLSANQYQLIEQRIEGSNVQGIKKGTSNAQPVTLSFWVRSSNTGTYIVELRDEDNTRTISQTYTINSANTWEKKTITYPADTTGAFDNDSANSLTVFWWLAAGSTWTSGTLQTTWGTQVTANRAVGQTNLLATAGNDFFLTGVQLEVGDRATEFERSPFGQQLALCQRYYQQWTNANGAIFRGQASNTGNHFYWMPFAVVMRSAPVMSVGSPTYSNASGAGWFNIGNDGAEININVSSAGGYAFVKWTASSEL